MCVWGGGSRRRIQVNERDTVLALHAVLGVMRRQTEVWQVLAEVDDAHRGYRDGDVQHARYASIAEQVSGPPLT